MTAVVADPATVRKRIENALREKIGRVPFSGTVGWLVQRLGCNPSHTLFGAACERVGQVLTQMQAEGLVTTRRLRSGEMVWKLTDKHHKAWQALSNSITSTREK